VRLCYRTIDVVFFGDGLLSWVDGFLIEICSTIIFPWGGGGHSCFGGAGRADPPSLQTKLNKSDFFSVSAINDLFDSY
jgi:hypothetical protein